MFLGIEFGGTKLQCAVGTSEKIIETRRFSVDPEKGAAGLRAQLETAIPEFMRKYSISAAGAGFGGPVDRTTGTICRSHQIEGWSGFPLRDWLTQLIGAPVAIENDANTAALGEALRGTGRGFNPVFYITLGSGVGGGLVTDGAIYHGASPGEAEIGHVRLDRQGTIVESRCSGWAVDKRIRELARENPNCILARSIGSSRGGEARFLARSIEQGDTLARGLLAEVAEDLAFGLSHVVHLFHPEIILLGGGFSFTGELLRSALEQALDPFLMEVFRPGPAIRLAGLGENAVPIGALALAAEIR